MFINSFPVNRFYVLCKVAGFPVLPDIQSSSPCINPLSYYAPSSSGNGFQVLFTMMKLIYLFSIGQW